MEPPEVVVVGGQPGQVLGRDLAKQHDRIPAGLLPAGRVERGEQVSRVGMPGPAKVQHEVVQRSERLGQCGTDREGADGSHAERPYRLPGTSGFGRGGRKARPAGPGSSRDSSSGAVGPAGSLSGVIGRVPIRNVQSCPASPSASGPTTSGSAGVVVGAYLRRDPGYTLTA